MTNGSNIKTEKTPLSATVIVLETTTNGLKEATMMYKNGDKRRIPSCWNLQGLVTDLDGGVFYR